MKILGRLVVIFGVLLLAITVTRAVWSDSGVSSGNVFQAGTLDLKLTDDNEGPADNVTVTWEGSEMSPGGDEAAAELKVRNGGTVAADHVHFQLANTITEAADGPGADDSGPMDQYLQITSLTYDSEDILGYLEDINGNGWVDLDDWENTPDPGLGDHTGASVPDDGTLPLTDLDTDLILAMSVKLNAAAADANQGDTVETVMTAVLHQVDGQ